MENLKTDIDKKTLTKTVIDKATYGGGWDVRWDEKIPGFGVRIYPSGRKTFVLSYRAKGIKHLMALGNYGAITLDQARNLAHERLHQIAIGYDPLAERKRERQGELVRDLCTKYIEEHAKPHKRSWKEDDRKIKIYILPEWGGKKVKTITENDVASLHLKIGKNSIYEANRTVALLSKMFSLAKRPWGFVDLMSPNPATGIRKFPETKRDRWLTPEELPRLAAAIEKEENIYIRAAIWLYLFTGLRRSELLSARWEDVDFNRLEMRIPRTKAGRRHYIPLSSPAIGILNKLPRLYGNPHILPGRAAGAPIVNISKAWLRIREAAKVDDVRLHDLRRTVGSWLAQSGNSLHLVGRVLNHTDLSTTKVYARFGEDHVRKALEKHGEAIIASSKQKPPSDIAAPSEGPEDA